MTRNQMAYFWAIAGITCIAIGLGKNNWQFCLVGAICSFMAVSLNISKNQ